VRKPVLVEAVRTPIVRRDGSLSGTHAAHLLGHVHKAVLQRARVDPRDIGQIIGGCVTQIGEQGFNITRTAWLAGALPYEVPATTIDCQCGSSQQAAHLVHNLIAAGAIDVGIACGVEAMSRVPIGANVQHGPGRPKPVDFPYDLPDRFEAAERIARKFGLTREEADGFGLISHQRALCAVQDGRFDREIVPIDVPASADGEASGARRTIARDEGPRHTTAERLADLKPVRSDGIHTAGTICQISDGASALLWMNEDRAREAGLRGRARLLAQVVVGSDPYYHIDGPIAATAAALKQARMTTADVDLFEINEAFASVVLAWSRTFDVDPARINVNGGAIALGHPMGATGSRLIASALHELERSGRSTALIAMCCGGAIGTASILERL
jgi:acetyl-CoA C-acetyltransferase